MVSTHSRLKAAGRPDGWTTFAQPVSTHSRLKAAGTEPGETVFKALVSTHSRLKAAGPAVGHQPTGTSGFNTQPPEGGWVQHFIA